MSTPQPLRSIVACRYLEVLAKYTRGHDDDLDEYCRQFQLCSELVSAKHVKSQTLADLFLAGLPLTKYIHGKHYLREADEFGQLRIHGVNIAGLIGDYRDQIAKILQLPRLASSSETVKIDRLLMSMEIKRQPKADFAEVAKFERFYAMLTSLDNEQLERTVSEGRIRSASAGPFTSSWGGTQSDKVQFAPSATSSERSETETLRDFPPTFSSEFATSANNIRDLLPSLTRTIAAAGSPCSCASLSSETQTLCETITEQLRWLCDGDRYDREEVCRLEQSLVDLQDSVQGHRGGGGRSQYGPTGGLANDTWPSRSQW